jgi:acetate kinase
MPSGDGAAADAAIDAAGVRVVHGGSKFMTPVRVDDEVLETIRGLADLAPLHNPMAVKAIEETRAKMPRVPIVAVFDTAFHSTMPQLAWRYAIPADVAVRRYGFHGISYSYVSSRVDARRHIICHLGSGASVCAVLDGKSVDTSMGFTPMEGLVMGTRSGDIDPGAILELQREGIDADELLNEKSGLLGVSGVSADVREVEKAAKSGNADAELALDLFAYRAAKYIGAYAAVLGGVDALTFTAGIGENSSSIRSRICGRLGFLGVELDEDSNRASRKDERRISRGPVNVWVIPTNEELEIARQVFQELST